jgi:hypothetical protein
MATEVREVATELPLAVASEMVGVVQQQQQRHGAVPYGWKLVSSDGKP